MEDVEQDRVHRDVAAVAATRRAYSHERRDAGESASAVAAPQFTGGPRAPPAQRPDALRHDRATSHDAQKVPVYHEIHRRAHGVERTQPHARRRTDHHGPARRESAEEDASGPARARRSLAPGGNFKKLQESRLLLPEINRSWLKMEESFVLSDLSSAAQHPCKPFTVARAVADAKKLYADSAQFGAWHACFPSEEPWRLRLYGIVDELNLRDSLSVPVVGDLADVGAVFEPARLNILQSPLKTQGAGDSSDPIHTHSTGAP